MGKRRRKATIGHRSGPGVIDYVSMYFLLAISGNRFFLDVGPDLVYLSALAVFAGLAYFRGWRYWDKKGLLVFGGALALILFLQLISYGFMVFRPSVGFLIRVSVAFLAVMAIRDFWKVYVDVMAWLAAIALIVYFAWEFGTKVEGWFAPLSIYYGEESTQATPIFHFMEATVRGSELARNSGMFWEPGAFAGYICLALLILVLTKDYSRYWRHLVLISGLLTTFSTTGYVAFFALLMFATWTTFSRHRSPLSIVFALMLAGVVLSGVLYVYQNTSFLQEKVESQMESAEEEEEGSEINRFGNLVYDLDFIRLSPITGWGFTALTRVEVDPEAFERSSGQGVGLTGVFLRLGLVGGLLYFYFIYKGFMKLSNAKREALFATAVVVTLLVGEQYTNYPLFWALPFFAFRRARKRKKRKRAVKPLIVVTKKLNPEPE